MLIKVKIKINIINIYLRIPISLQENNTLLESSLKYSILLSACKAVKSSSIILLVTNHSVTSFNAARESLTSS